MCLWQDLITKPAAVNGAFRPRRACNHKASTRPSTTPALRTTTQASAGSGEHGADQGAQGLTKEAARASLTPEQRREAVGKIRADKVTAWARWEAGGGGRAIDIRGMTRRELALYVVMYTSDRGGNHLLCGCMQEELAKVKREYEGARQKVGELTDSCGRLKRKSSRLEGESQELKRAKACLEGQVKRLEGQVQVLKGKAERMEVVMEQKGRDHRAEVRREGSGVE